VLNAWDEPFRKALVERSCDEDIFEMYSRYLKEGDTVFDVGAHIGRYSVFPSRIVGERGRVYAFEPVADNYWMLNSTIALNRCRNIVSINTALGSSVGQRVMNLFEKEFSSWSTFGFPTMTAPDGRSLSPSRKETVSIDTLDNVCKKYGVDYIDFLKIDVEGFEVEVIRGAANIRSSHERFRIYRTGTAW
jgi:FkbM family methyltransferase